MYLYFPNMDIDKGVLKSGAVKKTGTRTNDEYGDIIGNIYQTAKVYKEQRVRVKGTFKTALPQTYIDEGSPVHQLMYEELTWNQIKNVTDWSGGHILGVLF